MLSKWLMKKESGIVVHALNFSTKQEDRSNLKTIRTQAIRPDFSFVLECRKHRSLTSNIIKFKYNEGGIAPYFPLGNKEA